MRTLSIIVCLMLLVCVSCAPPTTPSTPGNRGRNPNTPPAPRPIVPPMRPFRRNIPAENLAFKNADKNEQRANAPAQQRISEQNRVNDIAKTLQRGNKQQTAQQIFNLQEQRRVKLDQIGNINKIVTARDPVKLIPQGPNPATAVKMNQLDKMNQADRLTQSMPEFSKLVDAQKADVAKLKQLNDWGIKGQYSQEYLTSEARAIQGRENTRMIKIRDFLTAENGVLERQADALRTATNNHNSPLQQEAELDEAGFDEEESVNEYDEVNANKSETVISAPKQLFHERRTRNHRNVNVNVEIDA